MMTNLTLVGLWLVCLLGRCLVLIAECLMETAHWFGSVAMAVSDWAQKRLEEIACSK